MTPLSRTCVNVNQCCGMSGDSGDGINLSYQDRVSLWVRGDGDLASPGARKQCRQRNPHENSVVIVSREKVTLRINPGLHERRWVAMLARSHARAPSHQVCHFQIIHLDSLRGHRGGGGMDVKGVSEESPVFIITSDGSSTSSTKTFSRHASHSGAKG